MSDGRKGRNPSLVRRAVVVACFGLLILAGCLNYLQRHSDVFVLHSTSDLHLQYAARLTGEPTAQSSADVSSLNTGEISKLFNEFYVVKDGATDCSFVATLMLMLQRDPSYPSQIVRQTLDGYFVRFPALRLPLHVTNEDMRLHHANWQQTRETYRRLWPGHIPSGLEILRTAYYNYQAEIGLRGRKGAVYNEGFPSQDLIMLSGTKKAFSIVANCPESSRYEASFASCPAQRFETSLGSDGRSFRSVETAPSQRGNPMETLGLRDDQLIIVTTSVNVPSWWGPRLVPYHAYYYLGRTSDGRYVLGNPYQTRRPVLVTPAQFAKHFLSVDFVNLDGSAVLQ